MDRICVSGVNEKNFHCPNLIGRCLLHATALSNSCRSKHLECPHVAISIKRRDDSLATYFSLHAVTADFAIIRQTSEPIRNPPSLALAPTNPSFDRTWHIFNFEWLPANSRKKIFLSQYIRTSGYQIIKSYEQNKIFE